MRTMLAFNFQRNSMTYVEGKSTLLCICCLPIILTKVQPIDAGCGMVMKKKIGEAMERWLENEVNLELWHDKISVRMRRVLMTKWTGEAWRGLREDKEFCTKLFEKTGCLMTVDCSGD